MRQIETPVYNNLFVTSRSTSGSHINNKHLKLVDWYKKLSELKDKLIELKIRFDTNPNRYQKEDYQLLIDLLTVGFVDLCSVNDIVTEWSEDPSDAQAPSEKLVKDTIDALLELLIRTIEEQLPKLIAGEGIEIIDNVINNTKIYGWGSIGDWSVFDPENKLYKMLFYTTTDNIKLSNCQLKGFFNARTENENEFCLISKYPITEIREDLFLNCYTLKHVSFPLTLTLIKTSAFENCTALLDLVVPETIECVEDYSFVNVPNIIYHGELNTENWGARAINGYVDGFLVYNNENKTELLSSSPELNGEVTLEEGTTIIHDFSFLNCQNITKLIFPSSLEFIGENVFNNTTLSELYFTGTKELWNSLQKGGLGNITIIHCLDGDIDFEDHLKTKLYLSSGEVITLMCDTLTREHVWPYLNDLISCEIGEWCTQILDNTFENCAQLLSIYIPNSVTSIGGFAFRGCSSLTSVTIPNSVTSIGRFAFQNCTSLTSVTIPNSVTSIEGEAFENCTSLVLINIPEGVTAINNAAWRYCTNLNTVIIPATIEFIGALVFWYCPNLTTVIYTGTISEYGDVYWGTIWPSSVTEIQCTDGTIYL